MVVRLHTVEEAATRYANSEITQNAVAADAELEVEAAFGSQTGQCSTNRLDYDSIAECVRRAEAIARVSPPDPEYMPPVEPMDGPLGGGRTFPLPAPDQCAEAVARAVALAERAEMTGAGSFTVRTRATAVGNSAGLFAHYEETEALAAFSATASDSVGWAHARAFDPAALDLEAVARRAIEKAAAGRSPRELEPGCYEVVLEAAAVAELLAFFFYYQMDAKAGDEGRTFLSGKRGKAIAQPAVTIYSDPASSDCPSRPFTDEGLPLRRWDWIREGVLTNLILSRYWAKKSGLVPTGIPTNILMEGGCATMDDMVAATRRGLLVTRFWYVRAVEPMRDLYTGMTRDGLFLIEDGRVAAPVKNLRFNESAAQLLNRVELIGRPQLTGTMLRMWVPPVKASAFQFTSATQF
ncbi:MAG: TldD/PmbA family protein [Candidatus Sumerlaeia bacterium]|nr:TldD/PmbA family protein [Candidatus Sumerlaeia bacterium]